MASGRVDPNLVIGIAIMSTILIVTVLLLWVLFRILKKWRREALADEKTDKLSNRRRIRAALVLLLAMLLRASIAWINIPSSNGGKRLSALMVIGLLAFLCIVLAVVLIRPPKGTQPKDEASVNDADSELDEIKSRLTR